MKMFVVLVSLWVSMVASAFGQKRLLHITHSAGFRHDSVQTSARALENIAERTGKFQVTATGDLSYLTAERLRDFDAVFFFTSGELPISEQQKRDLLEFVRSGKGFGGAHSATDTLYLWPEYGEMIGGYFDGHPWAQEVGIDVEDPEFPGMKDVAPSFRIVEEIYQFRAFSRERVRVLTTLDTSTVDLKAQGVNRTDGDFALSWVRPYGAGRVFYTALGHFDDTWLNPGFQKMLEGALLWMIGDVEADARPRPAVGAAAIGQVASPAGAAEAFAPGSVIAVYGERLSSGSTLAAQAPALPLKMAGTRAEVNGAALPLYYVSPGQVNAQLPAGLVAGERAELRIARVGAVSEPVALKIVEAAPALIAARREGGRLALYLTGLGRGDGAGVEVEMGGSAMRVDEASPVLVGVWRIVIAMPVGGDGAAIRVRVGGVSSNVLSLP